MIFEDRGQAGRELAKALAPLAGPDAVILAIPRGGVIVGAEVAETLGVPLDVVVPRKVRAPGNPELGLGAVAPGIEVLDRRLIASLHVSEEYLRREIETEREEIDRRARTYRGGRQPVDVADRLAIVVDDGVATGGTALAALRWAKAAGASGVIMAVPVAPAATRAKLERECDDVIALLEPESFFAVGQWYRDFTQVNDAEVVAAMAEAARPGATPRP